VTPGCTSIRGIGPVDPLGQRKAVIRRPAQFIVFLGVRRTIGPINGQFEKLTSNVAYTTFLI
jgi:hypothetical protein